MITENLTLYKELLNLIQSHSNHIPPKLNDNMWAVDSWHRRDLSCYFMHNNTVSRIVNDDVDVSCNNDQELKFKVGSVEDLYKVYEKLQTEVSQSSRINRKYKS